VEAAKELSEQTDRGAAIMAAAMLDEILKEFISSLMDTEPASAKRKSAIQNILKRSQFAAKIELAYASGWISEDEFDDLNVIRDIRNAFAHFSQKLTFSNPKIKNSCCNLKLGNKANSLEYSGLRVSNEARDIYLNAFIILSHRITLRGMEKDILSDDEWARRHDHLFK
jgi:DNA-binding MltR family transcriptional regulator